MEKAFEFVCMSFENAVCDDENLNAYLHPRELERIKNAVEKRKLEFLYGRLCAKFAYAKLNGFGAYDSHLCILNDSRSAPFFADGTRSVSITHGEGLAAAIVTDRERLSVGIDVQNMSPKHTQVITRFLSEKEKAFFDAQNAQYGRDFLATAMWVAKEALSKLLLLGFSVFDALEVSNFEKNGDLSVKFTNFTGFSVIIRTYGNYLFGFAAHNKDIEYFGEDSLVIEETSITALTQSRVFNKAP